MVRAQRPAILHEMRGIAKKESLRAYLRARYRDQRNALIARMGGKCVKCNETEGLIFDHIDPKQKSFGISALRGSRQLEAVYVELEKCQLLCGSCNLEKTKRDISMLAHERGFTHGTIYGWMKRHCGCILCSAARRSWHDTRNAARRDKAT